MKKLIIAATALLITGSTFLHGEEINKTEEVKQVDQSYGYYSFEGGFPSIITFNIGKRIQHGSHGLDAGIGVTPLLIAIEGHAYVNYLYYPTPNPDSQVYVGLGSQVGYGSFVYNWESGIGFIKPQLIFGKEFATRGNEKRFIQANLGGVYFSTKGIAAVPSLMVTYGIKF